LRQSTDLLIRRSRRGNTIAGGGLVGKTRSDTERENYRFQDLIKATHRLVAGKTQSSLVVEDMFTIAQWSQASEAAASLAQMAARQAKGDSALARLARERQDLVAEWQLRDKALTGARSLPSERRDSSAERRVSARLAAIDARVAEIDRSFASDFPEYAALARPEPLGIADVQKQLRPDEAFLLILDTAAVRPTPEETFIWVVTKSDARWVRSELGTNALAASVATLRCGFDQAAWHGNGADRCGRLLNGAYTAATANDGKSLPFDLARAHELYQALFGQVEDMISDKHLLVVPSGPLTSLPFQMLVSKKPTAAIPSDAAGYVDADWLIKTHAITVLPSVASLRAVREFAKSSSAKQPFIGFGNPLLAGPDGSDRSAWERTSCEAPHGSMQIARRGVRSGIPKFFRNGLANVEEVRAQYPLPETADELCAVARLSGAAEAAVYLGDKASETTIKAISADGTLAQARVLHFATHGLLAGEAAMFAASKAEPALILTPPRTATEEDDGLLTASEITQLKLDADWVILSACNTAGGDSDNPGAEALSGLARAFFYAGARALLVSHWAVNSEATVRLITKAFDELKISPKIGRAEALRRSMLALIGKGGGYAHPANWAPFVVVGEGAR
jgi:CHAT domain-containing protein